MTVNYFENCSFLGKCSRLWRTEAFLHCCRNENYNSSELTLAEEGMGAPHLTCSTNVESWTGSFIPGQETSRRNEGREMGYIALSLLPAVACNSLFPPSRSYVFNIERYCSDKWDALNLRKSCRNYVYVNLVV